MCDGVKVRATTKSSLPLDHKVARALIEKIAVLTGQTMTTRFVNELAYFDPLWTFKLLDATAGYLLTDALMRHQAQEAFRYHFANLYWIPFMCEDLQMNLAEKSRVENVYAYQKAMFTKNLMLLRGMPLDWLKKYTSLTVSPLPKLSVLDIGGGFGFYSAIFKNWKACVAIYEKEAVVELLPETSSLRPHYSTEPWQSSGRYDVIFVSEVLHGRTPQELSQWFKEFPNHLEENGWLIIQEVNPQYPSAYAQAFDHRIKIMTGGHGGAVPLQSVVDEARKNGLGKKNRWSVEMYGPYYLIAVGN